MLLFFVVLVVQLVPPLVGDNLLRVQRAVLHRERLLSLPTGIGLTNLLRLAVVPPVAPNGRRNEEAKGIEV